MADRPATPDTMGFREFADHMRFKPSYVTQLKAEGRLKLTPCGRRVLVAESKRLLADSMDPTKAGVAARHAAQRGAQVPLQAPAAPTATSAPAGDDDADSAPAGAQGGQGEAPAAPAADPIARQRAEEQLAQERLKRRALERQEAKDLGQLLERETTVAALVDFVTVLRNRLQGMPARLAPELGAADEHRCQALLSDEIEHALADLERKFLDIGREQ